MGRPTGARGTGRKRMLDAALTLFATHGVSGTSLQLIADTVGVTKAAVYHQFNSKDDIVLAVVQPSFDQLAEGISRAEAQSTTSLRRAAAIEGLVDLALDHREYAIIVQADPEVRRVLADHAGFLDLTARADLLLIGKNPKPGAIIALAVAGGGLRAAGMDPALRGMDRSVLRPSLVAAFTALLGSAV